MKQIYYEANTVENYYECAMELLNKYNMNTYEFKNHFCNYSEETVLGTEVIYDRKNYEASKIEKYHEMIDHIETLSNNLKDTHRDYKHKDENGKTKKNNEAVLLKVGLPYYLCEHKKYKPTAKEVSKRIKNLKASTNKIVSVEEATTSIVKAHEKKRTSRINTVCNELIKDMKPSGYSLPYLAFSLGEGNKHYLYILFIDRQFYKNSRTEYIYNKSTRYRNEKGFISKEKAIEQGIENVQVFEPGEYKFKKVLYWSSKVTEMWFGCRSSLEAKRHTFKNMIMSIFKRFKVKLNEVKERWIKHRTLRDTVKNQYNWKVVLYHKMYWFLYRKNVAINGLIDTFNNYYEKGLLGNDQHKKYYEISLWLVRESKLNSNKFERAIQAIREEFERFGYLELEDVKELVKGFKTA